MVERAVRTALMTRMKKMMAKNFYIHFGQHDFGRSPKAVRCSSFILERGKEHDDREL